MSCHVFVSVFTTHAKKNIQRHAHDFLYFLHFIFLGKACVCVMFSQADNVKWYLFMLREKNCEKKKH